MGINGVRVIDWNFDYALRLVFKLVCCETGITLLTLTWR